MKRVYLVRHAKAEDKGPDMSDFELKLTDQGKKDAGLMGKRLGSMSLKPDYVITSPAARARETCSLVTAELGFPPEKIEYEEDLFDAETSGFMEVLRSIPDEHSSVMVFGHNPSISEIAAYLCPEIVEGLSKGAVAAIRIGIARWSELAKNTGQKIFLETPKTLAR